MSELGFEVISAGIERYAVQPTIALRLRVTETTGAEVHAVALQCQIRIEPQKRRYSAAEQERLVELFGEPARWGETLRPFLWASVATTVTGFTGSTEVDLFVPCTYDMEIAGTRYLHALVDAGEVPLILLFSGTTFSHAETGMVVSPVAWHAEAAYRLPVSVWRELMDRFFPNSGWLTVGRPVIDALARFKAGRALATWDQTIEALLKEAGEDV